MTKPGQRHWFWVVAAAVGVAGGLANYQRTSANSGTPDIGAAAGIAAMLVLAGWVLLGALWLALVGLLRAGIAWVRSILIGAGLLGIGYDLVMLAGSWASVATAAIQAALLVMALARSRAPRERRALTSRSDRG